MRTEKSVSAKKASPPLTSVPLRFLKEFQDHCRMASQEKREFMDSCLKEMSASQSQIRSLLPKSKLSIADQQIFRRYAGHHIAMLDAQNWLTTHEAACIEISQATLETINVNRPDIASLWREFVVSMTPQWQEDFRALAQICAILVNEVTDYKPTSRMASQKAVAVPQASKSKTAATLGQKVETPKTKSRKVTSQKISPKIPAPNYAAKTRVADSAFYQNEDGSYEASPVRGEDYRDETEDEEGDDDEIDEEYFAEGDDLRYSSADPSTPSPGEMLHPPVEPPLTAKPPREIRYRFQVAPQSAVDTDWRALFDRIAVQIFREFNVDENAGATYIALKFEDEYSRQEYYADEAKGQSEGQAEAERKYVTRIQEAIIEGFQGAKKRNCCDMEKVLEDIRGILSADPTNFEGLNEFIHHSSGDSKFMRAQIEYEGSWSDGASLNDGFSIQTARRATRPFDVR